MKSEHRHELQTNELSAGLAHWIDKIKPLTGQIVTGAVLLALVYAGLSVWESQKATRERAAWDAFALANDSRDPEMGDLRIVAGKEEFDGTQMQEWAYVNWADRQVLNAMSSYLYDRKITEDRLVAVTGVYENLTQGAADSQVQNRARFGLARVYELQNKLDEARTQYLTVRGDLEPQASERAKQLDSEGVREACNWLATAELPKRDLTGGQGASGERPDFEASLPATEEPAASEETEEVDEEEVGEDADEKVDAGTKESEADTDASADSDSSDSK